MTKTLRSLSLLTTLLTLLTASAHATTLKIATVSPDGSAWMKVMRQAGDEIKKTTAGRVEFKFYPGGVMGSNSAVLKKMKIGQLQGAALSGGAFASYYPDSQVYNLPFLFRNNAEVDSIRQQFDPEITAGFEKGGLVTFGLAEGGFAYLMSNNKPVLSVADLRQQKVWSPNDDQAALNALGALGVTPTPLVIADVLPSLQTGLINTVTSSPLAAIALQWHTQVKHMTDMPMIYFYAMLGIDKKAFGKLSADDQKTVRDVMGKAFTALDQQNRKDNDGAYAALLSGGVSSHKPEASLVQEWTTSTAKAAEVYIQSAGISTNMVTRIQAHLANYRAAH